MKNQVIPLVNYARYNTLDFFLALIIINMFLKNVQKINIIFNFKVVIGWMMPSASISKALKGCSKETLQF